MIELLVQVLEKRDLSKAGALFSTSDWDIVSDLQAVLERLKEIFSEKGYPNDLNSQSVVEICLARITSAIRETGTIETYAPGLVDMLECCLSFEPDTGRGPEGNSHVKIASDLLSCLFLHYGKKSVMTVAIPGAVRALGTGNKDLLRNTSSYLSLAAIHNARLLAQDATRLIQSIITGNQTLLRVLPQVYPENREPFHVKLHSLLSLLPTCEPADKLSLLQFASMVADFNPSLLISQADLFLSSLNSPNSMPVALQILGAVISTSKGTDVVLKDTDKDLLLNKLNDGPLPTNNLSVTLKIIGGIGHSNPKTAVAAQRRLMEECRTADQSNLSMILKEIEAIAEKFPNSIQPYKGEIQKLSDNTPNRASPSARKSVNKLIEILEIQEFSKSPDSIQTRSCQLEINRSQEIKPQKVTVIPITSLTDRSSGKNQQASEEKTSPYRTLEILKPTPNGHETPKFRHNTPIMGRKTEDGTPLQSSRKADTKINGSHGMTKFVVTKSNPKGQGHAELGRLSSTGRPAIRSNLSRPKSRSFCNLMTSRQRALNALHNSNQSTEQFNPNNSPAFFLRGSPINRQYEFSERKGGHPANYGHAKTPLSSATQEKTSRQLFPSHPSPRPQTAAGHAQNRNSMLVLSPNGEYQIQYMNSKGRIRVSPSRPNGPNGLAIPELTSFAMLVNSSPQMKRLPPLGAETSTLQNQRTFITSGDSDASSGARKDLKSTGSKVVTTFYPNMSIGQQTGSGSALNEDERPLMDPRGVRNQSEGLELIRSGFPSTRDATTQSTATLEGERLSSQNYRQSEQKNDAVQKFCEKHWKKIRDFIHDLSTKYPVPSRCTVEESGFKFRMRVHFSCQEKYHHCLHNETFFAFKTKLPHLWLHLMFLRLQAQSTEILSQSCPPVRELKKCWECLPPGLTKSKTFSAIVTAMFPGLKEQQQLLKELQASRYFDSFAYNATNGKWACFACNHPEKVEDFMKKSPENPVLEGQLKEKRGRWKFFKRWQTKYFTLSGVTLSYREEISDQDDAMCPIELKSIRSVKSVSKRKRGRTLPKAFEIFTDDDNSYVLKAKDRKDAEEWFQCLQIAVAQAQKDTLIYQL